MTCGWTQSKVAGTCWNLLAGIDQERIIAGLQHSFPPANQPPVLFGDGRSAHEIVHILGEG
jgi:hypothetical protein